MKKLIRTGVYEELFWLFIGHDTKSIKYFNKYCKRIYDKDIDFSKGSLGYFIRGKENNIAPVIWIKNNPNTPETISVLVHEVLHYSLDAFHNRQIIVDNDIDHVNEPLAYFVDYCVMECLKAYNKNKKKKCKKS